MYLAKHISSNKRLSKILHRKKGGPHEYFL